ncbi:glycosyltransferase [Sediminibacter sp. Hel_I_10]|uniref:glycosyltransferase n=1 Tax=Sediminibacter sp. Hel_I_10 TaxID=1392490 RepID=UPI00047B8F4E|nr:glycosyltransferase [Sediminibacter sp. Hel_I_10]
MLSILIPVYKYNIVPLVEELYAQCQLCKIPFEILAYEDGSKSPLNKTNQDVNRLEKCSFKELETNIGRSAIRNLLARNAQYKSLLFVDAGTYPKNTNFVEDYLKIISKDVSIGGMTSLEKAPLKPYKLRWLYTKKRESNFKNGKVFCSSNFMIKKTIVTVFPFDESITHYGYEDVLFFTHLKKNDIDITYIENPVIHDSEDKADIFIKKTENAIENLIMLIASEKLSKEEFSLSKMQAYIRKLRLDALVVFFFRTTKPFLEMNFNSSYPSLILFDFYRLGYYCLINRKVR